MMADYDFLLADEWEDVSGSCECPTAPRQFLIPPPPPPPAMGVCGGAPVGGRSGGYFCHLEPMGAEFTQAGFPSLPVIAVCSSVVLVAVLVACFLLWRHKTKVQNLLPCKHDPHHQSGGPCAGPGANGVTYEDVLINHHPTRLPITPGGPPIVGGQTLMPIELLDVKLGDIVPQDSATLHPGSFYPCREVPRLAKPFLHPVYEEIPRDHPSKSINSKSYDSDMEGSGRGAGRSFTSEDEFAEDELSGLEYPSGDCSSRHCSATSSVQGSTGGDLCKDPVSSDEGTGDDCEYSTQGLPGLLPTESGFDYSGRKQANLTRLPATGVGELGPVPKTFHQPSARPSLSDDCAKPFLLQPRSGIIPQSNPQWCPPPPPICNVVARGSSVENIYSTIDEGDVVDNSHQPNVQAAVVPPSRNVQQGQSSFVSSKRNANKKQGESQLSQRNEEDSESYGDIMPAYDSASCAT